MDKAQKINSFLIMADSMPATKSPNIYDICNMWGRVHYSHVAGEAPSFPLPHFIYSQGRKERGYIPPTSTYSSPHFIFRHFRIRTHPSTLSNPSHEKIPQKTQTPQEGCCTSETEIGKRRQCQLQTCGEDVSLRLLYRMQILSY